MKIILILCFAMIVCGLVSCTTTRIVTAACNPPPEVMAPSDPLPAVTDKPLPQQKAGVLMIDDAGRYRALANRHDSLTTWIAERCK